MAVTLSKTTRGVRAGRSSRLRVVASSGKKIQVAKQAKVDNETVRRNLQGRSPTMQKKGWVGPDGRVGKGMGVYQFESKYGANVDGYSPIYTRDEWTDSGDTYAGGNGGLAIWAGLLVTGLAVGAYLIYSTSQLA